MYGVIKFSNDNINHRDDHRTPTEFCMVKRYSVRDRYIPNTPPLEEQEARGGSAQPPPLMWSVFHVNYLAHCQMSGLSEYTIYNTIASMPVHLYIHSERLPGNFVGASVQNLNEVHLHISRYLEYLESCFALVIKSCLAVTVIIKSRRNCDTLSNKTAWRGVSFNYTVVWMSRDAVGRPATRCIIKGSNSSLRGLIAGLRVLFGLLYFSHV